MTAARVLVLDIETSPNLAYVWRLWQENVGLSQLIEAGQVIAFAAKWHGEREVEFHADYNFDTGRLTGHKAMVRAAHRLVNEADAIVHYNGTSFDMPHLNREFLLAGLTPPAPHKDIDLYLTARKRFRFASNKLDHVARELGVGAKVSHAGFELWRRCMESDAAAWRTMRRYNIGDVKLTEKVYDRMLPWITSHPHLGLLADTPDPTKCGRCGGELVRNGSAYTAQGRRQRFVCRDCGGYSTSTRREAGVSIKPI